LFVAVRVRDLEGELGLSFRMPRNCKDIEHLHTTMFSKKTTKERNKDFF
jgi:hypothetical protein